eukprot:4474455-Prymnesium_polylepis.1
MCVRAAAACLEQHADFAQLRLVLDAVLVDRCDQCHLVVTTCSRPDDYSQACTPQSPKGVIAACLLNLSPDVLFLRCFVLVDQDVICHLAPLRHLDPLWLGFLLLCGFRFERRSDLGRTCSRGGAFDLGTG